MQNPKINSCKICGYNDKDFMPWGKNGEYPMFEICPCCSIESGYEDISPESIESNRKKWIRSSKFKSDTKYRIQLENLLK